MNPRLLHLAALLRWLGPWTPPQRVPLDIEREPWVLRAGEPRGKRARGVRGSDEPLLDAYVYHPRGPAAAIYLVAPGLHFLGPDDPRLDRFCRVLARAGFRVVAPFLPAFLDLRVEATAADDLELCARAAIERYPGETLTVFSISFGSWPALETAARLGDAIDGVITFGGYAEFEAAVRFCIDGVMRAPEGDVVLSRDPLNQPALFLNVLPYIDAGGDTRELEGAWREMAYRTWGKMELKQPGRLEPYARELVQRVPRAQRELFLIGCGVVPGASELVERALARAGDGFAFASPDAALARLACPVVVCHGRDDDVIPWGEALKLHARLAERVPARLLVTGLYGHTGAETPSLRRLAGEARTMLELARTLASAGRLRRQLGAATPRREP